MKSYSAIRWELFERPFVISPRYAFRLLRNLLSKFDKDGITPKGDDGNWPNDFFKDGHNSWVKPKDNRNCHRIIEKYLQWSWNTWNCTYLIGNGIVFPSCHCLDCDSVNLNVVFTLIMMKKMQGYGLNVHEKIA